MIIELKNLFGYLSDAEIEKLEDVISEVYQAGTIKDDLTLDGTDISEWFANTDEDEDDDRDLELSMNLIKFQESLNSNDKAYKTYSKLYQNLISLREEYGVPLYKSFSAIQDSFED